MLPPCDSDLASLAWSHWQELPHHNLGGSLGPDGDGESSLAKKVQPRAAAPEAQSGSSKWGGGSVGHRPPTEHPSLPALGSSSLCLRPVAFALLPGSERGIPRPQGWVQIQFCLTRQYVLWAWVSSPPQSGSMGALEKGENTPVPAPQLLS